MNLDLVAHLKETPAAIANPVAVPTPATSTPEEPQLEVELDLVSMTSAEPAQNGPFSAYSAWDERAEQARDCSSAESDY